MDVAVVGGSVAGLQTALTLGRARRRVVVFDGGTPRNRPAEHVHNFLTALDPSPGELLAAGRRQVAEYGVEVRDTSVSHVEVEPSTFVVNDVRVRALVLATGLRDELPDVAGVSEGWGRFVVACPHCHGWEVRDEPLVQLGLRGEVDRSVGRALLLSRWSRRVTFCTDGDELSADQLARLSRAGVAVRIERVLGVTNGRVDLSDGLPLTPRTVFVTVRQHQQSGLAGQLGCEVVGGAVVTDAGGRTNVSGVYAAGTTTQPALLAIGAAGHGSTVGVTVHGDLLDQDLR